MNNLKMDIDKARELAKSALSRSRFYHTECVAKAARQLALTHGIDEQKAVVAAYLHDILKERDKGDLLQSLIASDIMNFENIEKIPATWHAYAGGLYVRDELGMDDDIVHAVMYHTAGRAGMSGLEKVIFVADYISEDREFFGVPEVRELAQTSLDKACVAALRNSIVHICKKFKHIDTNSVHAFNELVDKRD